MAEKIFEHFFEKIFELFKKSIKEGVPGLHIPSFDPLQVPGTKHVSIHESFFVSAESSFGDIVVTGLSSFGVPKLHFDGKAHILSATTTTKAVQGKGNYALVGMAMMPNPLLIPPLLSIPLFGKSTFRYDIDSLTATIGLQFTAKDILKLEPKVKVDVKFGDTKLHLDNLDGGSIAGWLLNKIINWFSGKIAANLEKNIAHSMQDHLQKLIDSKLHEAGGSLQEALKDLATKSKL